MNVSLYHAAAAMSANARWQEVISDNLASASVPGFKKQDLNFEAVQVGMMSQARPDPRMQFTMPNVTAQTNFTNGDFRQTGVNTDVAIDGKGFFQVQLSNGAMAYTRDGEFHTNSAGQLVTKQGYLVMGDGGAIQVDNTSGGPLTISASGEISQNGIPRGKLRVVDFQEPNRLQQITGGYFTVTDPNQQPEDAPQTSVRQGYLEGSNVTPMNEMASLIGVMRSFEANQRLFQMHSERMSRTISELGSPN